VDIKQKHGPTAILDQAYAGTSYGVLHKSDQIEGLLARFLPAAAAQGTKP